MEVNNMNKQDDLIHNDLSIVNAQNDNHTNKEAKKSHGNRKLQRYRRKLRMQGMNSDAITRLISEWVDMDPRENNQIIKDNIQTTASNIHETTTTIAMKQHSLDRNSTVTTDDWLSEMSSVQLSLVKKKKKKKMNRKNNNNKNITKRCRHSLPINENNSSTLSTTMQNMMILIDNPIKLGDISDEIFCQMLSTAFGDTNKLDDYFLNETEKIEFVRHYTGLISRLFYIKLLQQQWNYYYHIGMTRNIWTGRISKCVAEKNFLCYTYGRSKKIVQQRRTQIQKQLQEINNTIELFEKEILLKLKQHTDCSLEMEILRSNIITFVNEHQQQFRNEFEYKREILILDATDHHLLNKFFHLKPNKAQMSSARHIWQATAKQILLEEQITITNYRLPSMLLSVKTDFFHQVLDDIDEKLMKSLNLLDGNASYTYSSTEFANLNQMKQQIIHQSTETARARIEVVLQTVNHEQHKFFIKKHADEYTSKKQNDMVDVIETRRLHMIERGKYITQQKLLISFKPSSYITDNPN